MRFPHSFVFDKPTGAEIFAVDRENELSSAEEEASGRITFGTVRCGRRLAVRFRVERGAGERVLRRRDGDDARVVPRVEVAGIVGSVARP